MDSNLNKQPSATSLGDGLKETAQTAADAVRQQAAQFAQDVGHERWRQNGATRSARCRGEVVLAAGAIGSVQLLKLSGVGPAAELARVQPALFIGGSVAAGFALARFLKSSARQRPSAGYDPYQR